TSDVQPGVRACTGVNPVTIRLSNFGTTTLTSAVVNWKVNNILQTPFNWSGTISSMGSIDPLTIGTYNFPSATIYTIKVWVTQPNSGTDAVAGNDTTTVTIVGGGMSGVYTIGGISPDFASMTQASAALNANGVCGPVTFRIRPGTYPTASFGTTYGASLTNTITFIPDNGDSSTVTTAFTFVGDGYYHVYQLSLGFIQLNGAKHIHINNCVNQGGVTSTANAVNENIEIDHCAMNMTIGMTGYSLHNGVYWVNYKNKNISIHDNDFIAGGVNLVNVVNTKLYNNTILQSGSVIVTDAYDTLLISRNAIATNGVNGMTIDMQVAGPGILPVIENNMVSVQGSAATKGMDITTKNDLDILYNTVRYQGTSGSDACKLSWAVSSDFSVNVINNNFSDFSGGYALEIVNPGVYRGDFNNFYTNGTYVILGPYPFGNIPVLHQWVAGSGQDPHSISSQPQFVSVTDLHANNDFAVMDAGTPLSQITTNIDNQPRNATHPDIGADEFTFVPVAANDAGVHNVDLPYPLCQGSNPVKVNIRNYGSAALTTVTVNWKLNGILQAPFVWNGNLASLDSTGPVTIANVNFMAPDTYNIRTWTSQPNSGVDGSAVNDTSYYSWITPQLSGAYTVGGTSPDFPDMYSVENMLNARGICGPVVFNLRPGNFSWGSSAQPVSGASPVNTITFQSENADSNSVHLSWLDLGNTAYMHFHQITLTSTINVGNGSNHINFTNCVFNCTLWSTNYMNEYFLVENNLFNASAEFAGSSGNYERGNIFRNNNFVSCSTLQVNTQQDVVVEGNSFDCPTSQNNPALGIVICRDSSRALRNYISGNYAIGLNLNGAEGVTIPVLIENNMIAGGPNMTEGIQCTSNTQIDKIYNNSVYINSLNGNGQCAWFQNSHADLKNNIFHNAGSVGYAYQTATANTITSSNYNDLFSAGPTLVQWQSTGCTSLAQLQTVSGGQEMNSIHVDPLFVSATDLHILNPALDGAGISLPDVLVDYDQELRQNPPDIGADERGFFAYDIGITTLIQPIPACEGVEAVSVKLKNFGTQNLTSAVIQWTMNGIPQTPVNWSGNLVTGGTTTVVLGNYTFLHSTPVQIKSWAEQPNGFADLFAANDTLALQTISPRMSGTFTIGGSSPDYP
ncbi:MAG TPA: hypothetical protein VFJ43_04655, partial [Bacteroidia bacterium]|nr:hypothetical protein [Bacteroidia bacterium]